MRVPFIKMHGLGNDFVVIDAREAALPAMTSVAARAIANRREGVGCDQVIVLEPGDAADFAMRIFNADGGEVEACGNASRAVALLHGRPARVETAGGVIELELTDEGASVLMGEPRFDWDAIPLAFAMDTAALPVGWEPLEAPMAVNVGNPHVVFFVEDANAIDLATLGPQIEHDPLFPDRINVNVASPMGPGEFALRVWERGAGLTHACGTGACATAVTAIRKGLAGGGTVRIVQRGGPLTIEWEAGRPIRMTGPAAPVFSGTFEWDDFA